MYKLFDKRNQSYLMEEDGTEFTTEDVAEAEENRNVFLRERHLLSFGKYIIAIHMYDDEIFLGEVMDVNLN